MIEIRLCASAFAQLVAAENALNRGFSPFAARFIRRNKIRGHDKLLRKVIVSFDKSAIPIRGEGLHGKYGGRVIRHSG